MSFEVSGTTRLFEVITHSDVECPADFDGDGTVDSGDFGEIFAQWGSCGKTECTADLSGDGIVDAEDLGRLISAFGPCP